MKYLILLIILTVLCCSINNALAQGWERVFQGNGANERATSMIKLSDGTYIVSGDTIRNASSRQYIFLKN